MVYPPPSEADTLPFHSSEDLGSRELGEPLADLTLKPGDLLYLPRGYVHQARTVSSEPSLHMTVSIARRHTWRDLLELGLRGAIEAAAADDVAWRRSLPREYLSYMGAVHSDSADRRRVAFERTAHRLLSQLLTSLPLDAACDQFVCSNLMHERLPPFPANADSAKLEAAELTPRCAIRLRTRHIARLAIEGDAAVLYHHVENTRVYRELAEPASVAFAMEALPALDRILSAYPKYVTVGKLPLETDAQKLDVASALVEAKLVFVKQPVNSER
uniref:Bifunctional lysine-specific demethylase and histidyl-hydroxylase n=1 Tax=Calcidiscus leptoporus TaxID=127549 RepID=A0A7S0JIT5_9EUKA